MASDHRFEWHHAKARSDYAKHGVTFDTATKAFADPFMVEVLDDSEDYGDERVLGDWHGPRPTVERCGHSEEGALSPDLREARDKK
jgi:hypothetical protein